MNPCLRILVPVLFFLTACRQDDSIQTYRVSKESDSPVMPGAPAMGGMATNAGGQSGTSAHSVPRKGADAPPMTDVAPPTQDPMASAAPMGNAAVPGGDMNTMGARMGLQAAGSSKDIAWSVPQGWTEQAPSTMRVGSFLIKGRSGQTADVSVVPLAGEAGGDLANINRWRGQLNLQPVDEAALRGFTRDVTLNGKRMRWVEVASDEKMIGNQFKKRLVAAIYKQGERLWFFKMIGEDETVRAATPAFQKFLESLRFRNSQ